MTTSKRAWFTDRFYVGEFTEKKYSIQERYLYRMAGTMKTRAEILQKLEIEQLNQMQVEADEAILKDSEVVLLSPTGTGKTLAFLLPIVSQLDPNSDKVQVLILAPSRELAIQIEQVARDMGSGFKTNAVYGGRSGSKDRMDIKHPPALLIGTPGRVADHIRRGAFDTTHLKTLVLDEFDKCLEVGFEKEMREIVDALPHIRKKILTSATRSMEIPEFVGITDPTVLQFLTEDKTNLKIHTIVSPTKDKLGTLVKLLKHLGDANGIIFCNYKDTIQFVSDHLNKSNIRHACFFGGLEQIDRERALIKFRNGTVQVLLATDLAARGIDVPEMDYIIHYQLPFNEREFTHRNGRTARMHRDGTAYVMRWEEETLRDFVQNAEELEIPSTEVKTNNKWQTLYISGGRKDKISKGDIAGLFFKQGNLEKDELGIIELKQECAFVAVPESKSNVLVQKLNNSRLKKKKVRISILD